MNTIETPNPSVSNETYQIPPLRELYQERNELEQAKAEDLPDLTGMGSAVLDAVNNDIDQRETALGLQVAPDPAEELAMHTDHANAAGVNSWEDGLLAADAARRLADQHPKE